MIQRFEASGMGDHWIEMPNFYKFFRDTASRASIEAVCGSAIFELTPNLCDLLWDFDASASTLVAGLPRWMIPRAFAARDRMIQASIKWHRYANEHLNYTGTSPGDPEWDPYFGSKLVKRRKEYMKDMDLVDEYCVAAEDLGLLFAATSNAIPSVCWMVLYAVIDPALLSRARREIEPTIVSDDEGSASLRFDFAKLTASPLLQSMYAETPRLGIANLVTRTPVGADFRVGPWRFPKGQIIFLNNAILGQAPQLWNAGAAAGPHPLTDF